ncbi:MAG: hypothetical protein DWH91_08065 [Planctomycetota bacterium]|nr:MAG: hypothetical protein DWH91_08065 [Planctomycetota bacterium]
MSSLMHFPQFSKPAMVDELHNAVLTQSVAIRGAQAELGRWESETQGRTDSIHRQLAAIRQRLAALHSQLA